MAEPIAWLADGTPASKRFGDRYHSSAGHGLPQARGVFLHGCGLPQAWHDQAQWRILETGFGLGLNFLVTWAAWRADPRRPRLLHFISCEAWPVAAGDLLRAAPPEPELQALAAVLADQFHGLLPGVHRLAFENGRVLLTLLIGDARAMLRAQRPRADSVYLDGFDPRRNPELWNEHALKAVARCCERGTRLATWCSASAVHQTLAQCGFVVNKVPGVAPKRENLHATYDPSWEPHSIRLALPSTVPIAGRQCIVIGAGLAGAAVAASLARRGWWVTVLDAATPASGASGVPAAIVAPHHSPDDSVISRISRAGVRATLTQLRAAMPDADGRDWGAAGVLEHRVAQPTPRLPRDDDAMRAWSRHADRTCMTDCHLPVDAPALWHASGGWLRPKALVEHLLAQPGITVRSHASVARVARDPRALQSWAALGADGAALARANLIVLCTGALGHDLAAHTLPLQAVRGMVSWAEHVRAPAGAPWPPCPVNGHGTLIPRVPSKDGEAWVLGATFERDQGALPLTAPQIAGGHGANHAKLDALLPALGRALAPSFDPGRLPQLHAWAGVRCTAPDHLPVVGPVDDAHRPGLWICTGLGARGAALAALCGELLAARLMGEPLPLDAKLARALCSERFAARTAQSGAAAAQTLS